MNIGQGVSVVIQAEIGKKKTVRTLLKTSELDKGGVLNLWFC